jgi:Na+/H+ antiporter NhaD/arsenite permease-like protein
MRESTVIIIAIGLIPIAVEVILLLWGWLSSAPSYDGGVPWAVMIMGIGLCIVVVGLLKWLLLDWLLGVNF